MRSVSRPAPRRASLKGAISRTGWDARATAIGDPTMHQGKDVETLTHELRLMKQKCSQLELENQSLRTQLQSKGATLKKKDKQLSAILSLPLENAAGGEGELSARLRALKSEMMSVAKLSGRVRELEQMLAKRDDELKVIKTSMKTTNIRELQIEAQTYFEEARRLKKMLEQRRTIPTATDEELYRLREEVKALRREGMMVRAQRDAEGKSASLLSQLHHQHAAGGGGGGHHHAAAQHHPHAIGGSQRRTGFDVPGSGDSDIASEDIDER